MVLVFSSFLSFLAFSFLVVFPLNTKTKGRTMNMQWAGRGAQQSGKATRVKGDKGRQRETKGTRSPGTRQQPSECRQSLNSFRTPNSRLSRLFVELCYCRNKERDKGKAKRLSPSHGLWSLCFSPCLVLSHSFSLPLSLSLPPSLSLSLSLCLLLQLFWKLMLVFLLRGQVPPGRDAAFISFRLPVPR